MAQRAAKACEPANTASCSGGADSGGASGSVAEPCSRLWSVVDDIAGLVKVDLWHVALAAPKMMSKLVEHKHAPG